VLLTSYAALTGMEELARVLVNHESVARTALDNLGRAVRQLDEAVKTASSVAALKDQHRRVGSTFSELKRSLESTTATSTDVLQHAVYQRRIALMQGAPAKVQAEALSSPVLAAPNALGIYESDLSKVKSEKKSATSPSTAVVAPMRPPAVPALTSEAEPIKSKAIFLDPNSVRSRPKRFSKLEVTEVASRRTSDASVHSTAPSTQTIPVTTASLHSHVDLNPDDVLLTECLDQLDQTFDLGEITQLLELSPQTLSLLHSFKP
jgi:hypothetical protein